MPDKKPRLEPDVDWVPLRQAVFVCIGENGRSDGVEEASFSELEDMLAEKSGAFEAEINTSRSTFSFCFYRGDGGGCVRLVGTPWDLLRDDPAEPAGQGLLIVPDIEPSRDDEELSAVRKATGLVWRQFVRRTFDRAVSTGAVLLYARTHGVSARFERLPADVWPLLDVADWQNGVALAFDGTTYSSIHVDFSVNCESSVASSKKASVKMIDDAIQAVYDQAQADRRKPPNIRELPAEVQALLPKGYHASGNAIITRSRAPRFASRRRTRGKTLRSERSARRD